VPLTLSAFLESVAARLDRLHEGTAGVLLRAVPVKGGGSGKVYGGFVYASLRDPRTGDAIDARIPEGLAPVIEWNREAVFVGLLRYKGGRGGVVKPEFRVDAIPRAPAYPVAKSFEKNSFTGGSGQLMAGCLKNSYAAEAPPCCPTRCGLTPRELGQELRADRPSGSSLAQRSVKVFSSRCPVQRPVVPRALRR
jgi:hypothetical protein